jgi:hypothetical protein
MAPAQDLKPAAKLQERYVEAQKLYEQKHFSEAAAILEPIYAAGPDGRGREWYTAVYDLACQEALAGSKNKALEVLTASQDDGGSVTAEHLGTDTDLTSLHGGARMALALALVGFYGLLEYSVMQRSSEMGI